MLGDHKSRNEFGFGVCYRLTKVATIGCCGVGFPLPDLFGVDKLGEALVVGW